MKYGFNEYTSITILKLLYLQKEFLLRRERAREIVCTSSTTFFFFLVNYYILIFKTTVNKYLAEVARSLALEYSIMLERRIARFSDI
jgi:hypothetical protein